MPSGRDVGKHRHDVLKVETLLANTGDHDLEDGPTGYQKRLGLAVDGHRRNRR
jgi:hypothetical protein